MEWIGIGILLAIGWYLAPYVIALVIGIIYAIWMALTDDSDKQHEQSGNVFDLKKEDWHEKH